jgi:redox-sensitive bicupin YhaK (pirin superfamily)
LYQIWLLPREQGIQPSYEQKAFAADERQGRLRLVASPDAADGSLAIQQDARIYLATLAAGDKVEHPLSAERFGWLQVLRGSVTVNGTPANTSDGVAIGDEPSVKIAADGPAEVMLFDMA